MTMASADSSPDQFHGESLTSPLNPNYPPSHHSVNILISDTDTDTSSATTLHPLGIQSDQSQGGPPPAGGTYVGRTILSRVMRRSKRPAKYPTPFNRYFKQLELWKLCAMFWAIFGSVATFVDLKLVSKEFMRALLVLLTVATFSFMVAHTLQDMVPEVAVAAMLTGIGLVIALFHAVVFKLLHLPERAFRLAVSVFLVAYSFLLGVTLYKLFKEDVREKEDTDENGPGIDTV